jgi:hypothetical protein
MHNTSISISSHSSAPLRHHSQYLPSKFSVCRRLFARGNSHPLHRKYSNCSFGDGNRTGERDKERIESQRPLPRYYGKPRGVLWNAAGGCLGSALYRLNSESRLSRLVGRADDGVLNRSLLSRRTRRSCSNSGVGDTSSPLRTRRR